MSSLDRTSSYSLCSVWSNQFPPIRRHETLYTDTIHVPEFTWIWKDSPPPSLDSPEGFRGQVMHRYRMKAVPCTVRRYASRSYAPISPRRLTLWFLSGHRIGASLSTAMSPSSRSPQVRSPSSTTEIGVWVVDQYRIQRLQPQHLDTFNLETHVAFTIISRIPHSIATPLVF